MCVRSCLTFVRAANFAYPLLLLSFVVDVEIQNFGSLLLTTCPQFLVLRVMVGAAMKRAFHDTPRSFQRDDP